MKHIFMGINFKLMLCFEKTIKEMNDILDFMTAMFEKKGETYSTNELLLEAVQNYSPEVVEYLIFQGGDINYMQGECLRIAIKTKNYSVVECILKNPEFTVDSSIVNIVIQTAVDVNIFRWFVMQKKHINEQYLREIVKHSITFFVIQRDITTLQLFVDNLGPLNYIGHDAVINAINYDFIEILTFLYHNGADVFFDNHFPLVLACTKGKLEIVKFLYSNGSDIYAQNNKPFIVSLSSGNLQLVKFLLQQGVNATINREQAIKIAESQFDLHLIEILIDNGCSGRNVTWESAKKFINKKNINPWWYSFQSTKDFGTRVLKNTWENIYMSFS
uniref:Uncharacterized protein n=1 Tax=viral metagenome TaxID=1070528 RepID=A0A6C0KSF2_9ZZZZ